MHPGSASDNPEFLGCRHVPHFRKHYKIKGNKASKRVPFPQRLRKEHNKTLEGSALGRNNLKTCPKRLPIELPSRLIFRVFLNFCL